MDLRPGQVIDRYRVEAQLASGGMATVYRVRHTKLHTLHALKVLMVPAKHLMERLILEGRAQAQLKHGNIVAVTDVIEVSGAPGLVMELIEGPSLHDLLRDRKLTLEQADALGRDIIRAVAHAHGTGMIHRDLKPANVMLAIEGGVLVPKVTDFGLAKLLHLPAGGDKTASGLAMGTPAYMAPEQYRDAKSVGKRADVFSLGAILYELVTGERAFQGEEMITVYHAVSSGRYVDPRELVPELPDRMAHAIAGALKIDSEERIADCGTLLRIWCGVDAVEPMATIENPTWSASILDHASSLGSGSGVQVVGSDEPEPGGPVPPTLDPGSTVGDSNTIYASLTPTPTSPAGASPVDSVPPTLEFPAPVSNTGRLVAVTVVALGVVVPATLLLGLWLVGYFERPAPIEPVAVSAPAPLPEPAVAPEPEEAPVEVPAPNPAPVSPAPAPRPRPAPAPTPAPSVPVGTVVHTGDGSIVLVDAKGVRHPPGELPAGEYKVLATFETSNERDVRTVTVVAGRTLTLYCNGRFGKCTPK